MSLKPLKKSKKLIKRLSRRFAPDLRELLLLWFISKKPAHGYEIIKRFDEMGADGLHSKANRVYPELEKMTHDGYLDLAIDTSGSVKKPRKIYTLTPEGKKHLLREVDELRHTIDSIGGYLDTIHDDLTARQNEPGNRKPENEK